jgi:Ni/Fe-hydrogenase 1 B-type cytochrome subunit
MAEPLVVKEQWSVAMRINHWAMAACIVILIISGFYIGRPLTIVSGETWQKFFMVKVGFIHLLFGFILTALFVWRAYLSFFSRFHADWKDFFAWLDFKSLNKQVRFYTLLSNDPPPEHAGLYGTVQSSAYGFLLMVIFLIVITGLILYGAVHHAGLGSFISVALNPLQNTLSGLAGARFFHHVLTWAFVLFICIHIYMAIWTDVVLKENIISSMINGRMFKKENEH